MEQPTPPSPAPSIGGFLHQPSSMRPSMNTSHPRDGVARGSEFLGYPRLQPRHSSPDQEANTVARAHPSDYSQNNFDVSLAEYTVGQDPFNSYGPLPGELGYSIHIPYTPEASPPTPSPANISIKTRSGMSIAKRSAISKSAVTKGGRVQKRSRDQKQKYSSSIVGKPLTQIALDMPRLPVADMGTFVHRSAEDRHLETARNRKSGQIKRPMNAFMLYRKAYQEVAKTQCTKNNHQHVSKVCGAGWALESAEVHEEFNEWARIERANHQQAHPGYKFTPSKTRKGKRENETGDGGSEADDPDWGTRRELPRSIDQRANTRNVLRLSETPSLTYDPAPGALGDQSTAAYLEMLGYATPQPSQVLPYYHPVHSSPYDPHIHQYPHAFSEFQPALDSRHSSPNVEYPAPPLDNGSAFLDNYYPEVTIVTETANDASFQADRLCDELLRFNNHALGATEDFWPHVASAPNMAIVEFGGTSEHDNYLRGTAKDWEVTQLDEPLDEASQFESWLTPTEDDYM
ncbi:hypothetical protein B0J13DRAFT_519534 [Dactylonectria estremocensis]|uniref:HMG box domain-containing protein n=1 Tax=Dactylonectria estremocensis TaxID=1079267 RepID=A0A9P9FD23_9HYPO|nr:hypothetical protein B0J13DRAFT_519534 [Dactylonectria estremocensis]